MEIAMRTIDIIRKDGVISIAYEEKTTEKVNEYLNKLKGVLDTNWNGVCPVFDLRPDANGARTIRRWRNGSQEMPVSQWKLLLVLLNGQGKL